MPPLMRLPVTLLKPSSGLFAASAAGHDPRSRKEESLGAIDFGRLSSLRCANVVAGDANGLARRLTPLVLPGPSFSALKSSSALRAIALGEESSAERRSK